MYRYLLIFVIITIKVRTNICSLDYSFKWSPQLYMTIVTNGRVVVRGFRMDVSLRYMYRYLLIFVIITIKVRTNICSLDYSFKWSPQLYMTIVTNGRVVVRGFRMDVSLRYMYRYLLIFVIITIKVRTNICSLDYSFKWSPQLYMTIRNKRWK